MSRPVLRPTLWRLAGAGLAILLLAGCAGGAAPSPTAAPAPKADGQKPAGSAADQLQALNQNVDGALAALASGDLAGARSRYEAFDAGWDQVEDSVKSKSPDAYKAIEDAMDDVQDTLVKAQSPDAAKARDALTKLKQTVEANVAALR